MVKLLLHSLLSLRIGTYYNQGLLISWAYITSNYRAFYTIVCLPLNLKLLALHNGVIHVDLNLDGTCILDPRLINPGGLDEVNVGNTAITEPHFIMEATW
uniref:Uncharacterized protein n=1 Tax=Aegilops tauschii TaxID=37682 RepID=M8CTK7_AEGTA